MTWTYQTVGTFGGADAINPSCSPGAPSGVAAGDLLLLAGYARDFAGPDTPSGWTDLAVGTARLKLWARIATGGAEDTPSVTGTGTGVVGAQIARWTGGPSSLTGIVHTSANRSGSESAFDITTPARSGVSHDNCLVVYLGGATNDLLGSPTMPNGSTSIGVTNYNGTGATGNDLALAWSYAIQTTAADIAAASFDGPNTGAPETNALVALLIGAESATTAPAVGTLRLVGQAPTVFSGNTHVFSGTGDFPPLVLTGNAIVTFSMSGALTVAKPLAGSAALHLRTTGGLTDGYAVEESRWASNANQLAANASRVVMVTMVELAIPGDPLYLHDGIGRFTWNAHEWLGVGQYGGINTVSEGTEMVAAPAELTLSGVDSALINDAMTTQYHGEAVTVYIALWNPDTDTMVDDPEIIWEGQMDTMQIEVGPGTGQITLTCEHRLRRLPVALRYTDEDQQALHPGDRFFSRLHQIPQYRSRWGDKDAAFSARIAGGLFRRYGIFGGLRRLG